MPLLEDSVDQTRGQVVDAEVGDERREDRDQQLHAVRKHRIRDQHRRRHRHKGVNELRNSKLRRVHAGTNNKRQCFIGRVE